MDLKPISTRYAGKPRPKGSARRPGLGTHDFLRRVEATALAALPPELAKGAVSRVRFSLVQFHFGDPTVHYEVWVQRRSAARQPPGAVSGPGADNGCVEAGLHFEGRDGERNRALLAGLVARADELIARLGDGVEPEEWTRSWTRLHETVPLREPLSIPLAEALGRRIAQWMATCEPLLRVR